MNHARCLTLGALCLVLFAAMPRAATAQDVYNDNVVIVLDASGSMSRTMRGVHKLEAAKQAIVEVLRTVPHTTQVGLLVFTSTDGQAGWVYPLGPRDDARLLKALTPIRAKGGTPLGEYIKRGADRLLEQRENQLGYGTFRLLVVTDGEATDGPLTDRYVPEVIAKGILLDVIGVDMAKDHALATRAHSYRSASDPASLKRAIAEVLAEVAPGDRDVADADAFAMLEPLPTEAAQAIINGLKSPDNRPIGSGTFVEASIPPPAGRGAPGPTSPSGTGSAPTKKGKGFDRGTLFVIIIVIIVVTSMARKRARR